MSSDRSRRPDELRDGYKEVVAQQGRVILDRDLNAAQSLTAELIARDALDLVGPCGTPDDGFAISLPVASPPEPLLWSPPAFPDLHTGERFDFLISPGTMFVGGERAFLPGRQSGHAITYSYFDQPDWIAPPEPDFLGFARGRFRQPLLELVYLELTEQEVSAVEDPELLDVALGGPDTTQRIKLLRRVKRQVVSVATCDGAWQEATALWLQRDGRRFDSETMRLEPVVRLQVGFTQAVTEHDPCDPVATGGYLGADNQLIRVQIGGTTKQPQLLWSYDNASFLYRVTSVSTDRTMLTLAKDPPDAFHIPQTGQLVEVLRSAAVLGKEPDESDPTGQAVMYRVAAEARGELRRLVQPFGPFASGDPTKFIVLDQPLPATYAADKAPLFLRIWRAELALDPAGGTIALDDPATGTSTGVQVTISVPKGEPASIGTFWQLAFRPATPQGVYPERLLDTPQPPDGPRQWVCPLAVIDWTREGGPQVTDCRQHFESVVELTRRKQGCCTVSVSPKVLTATNTLQVVINRAAGLAEVVTVCLNPGAYQLSQPLRLNSMHSKMTIEGCGGGVTIEGDSGADPKAFSDGLIVVTEANGVTLRGLQLQLPAASQLLIGVVAMIGIRAAYAGDLTVEGCSFQFSPPPPSFEATIIFGAGIFLQGDCSGLIVRGCSFASNISPTLTPFVGLSATATTAAPEAAVAALWDLFTGDLKARFQTVITQAGIGPRILGGATAAAAQFVAIVGCLAATQGGIDAERTHVCRLGDAAIRDSSFSNLTLPVAFNIVDTRTARLQDNDVTECLDGFWLWLNGFVPPTGNLLAFSEAWRAILFQEYYFIYLLGVNYPLPLPSTPTPPTADGSITPAALFLTGNQIETKPSGSQGSTAMMVLADRPPPVDGQDTSVSLTVSGNRLRSQTSQVFAPTALLVVAYKERCAITGNLIFNDQAAVTEDCSSLKIIPNSIRPVELLTVVGNVLWGRTNLDTLTRNDAPPPPFDTWVPFNSILQHF